MTQKHFEWAAHYVVNDVIGNGYKNDYILFYKTLESYNAFVAQFNHFGARFDINKFNKRIENLLNK